MKYPKLYRFILFLAFHFSFFTYGVWSQAIVLPPDYIKSVQIFTSEGDSFAPVLPKNGSLTLSFDDLEGDEKDYYYLIEHCDRHWETSDLLSTEFLRGYQKEKIWEYRNSFNTLQNFTHYTVTFPNEKTQFLISGNYRISILDDYDEVAFSRYFVVYEPLTTVGVSVHQSRDVRYIDSQQSVQFIINHPDFTIHNPQTEIHPVVFQNFDFTTQIKGLQPQFIRGDQLIYKYDAETAFWAGNEYLNFDTKDLLQSNMTVAMVVSGKHLYESYLFEDHLRAHDPYTYYPDVNGNFMVRNAKTGNSDIEADYTWVHFTLKMPEYWDKKVYVYGSFNHFQITDENKMTYNEVKEIYEAQILLKQGFYNYQYVTLNNQNQLNTTEINGSFYPTENQYQVLVYYTKFGSTYDRVIGYGVGSSLKLQN